MSHETWEGIVGALIGMALALFVASGAMLAQYVAGGCSAAVPVVLALGTIGLASIANVAVGMALLAARRA